MCRKSIDEVTHVYVADNLDMVRGVSLGRYFGHNTFHVYIHKHCSLECEAILMLLGVPWIEVVVLDKGEMFL